MAAFQFVEQVLRGGVIAFVIVALSVALFALCVVLLFHLRYAAQCPDELLEEAQDRISRGECESAASLLASDPSALGVVMEVLLKQRAQPPARLGEILSEVSAEQSMLMAQRVAYVGLIAAIAPMLGLLGTVSGMISAFATMSATTGAPDTSELAASISEALITTYLGLIVAIPALVANMFLRHRVLNIMLRVGEMAEQFIEMLHPDPASVNPAGPRLVKGPQPALGRP